MVVLRGTEGGGSLQLGRVGALIVAFVFALALAGTGHAGLHSALPANAFGTPADVFYDNDALFAYTVSDFTGGYVCVVDADAPAWTRRAMQATAWGSKNRVVGIGTEFTLLEGGSLTPGHWRLQTVNSEARTVRSAGSSRSLPCEV